MKAFFEGPLEARMKGSFIRRSGSARTIDGMRIPRPSLRRALAQGGRRAAALAALLWLAAAGPGATVAHAGNPGDHEQARAAVQAGEVLPLPALLERLAKTHPGQVLELELERDDGRWIYEVRLLEPGGRVAKLEVDARTGEVIKLRRKGEAAPAKETR